MDNDMLRNLDDLRALAKRVPAVLSAHEAQMAVDRAGEQSPLCLALVGADKRETERVCTAVVDRALATPTGLIDVISVTGAHPHPLAQAILARPPFYRCRES
jgi:hypothetical protein